MADQALRNRSTKSSSSSSTDVKDDGGDDDGLRLISHQLPNRGPARGALAIASIFLCMVVGPAIPGLCLTLWLWFGYGKAAALLAAAVALSMAASRHSPAWCRFYISAAGWFKKGVHIHMEKRALAAIAASPSMWCMHPHGTSIGFGFSLNGAVRLRAEDEATFLPPEFTESVSVERCRRADGVQAPVLFRIPLLRSALLGFGCCTPATKRDMGRLFSRKIDFGILPGGMEEVALYTRGRERVYLRKRAGFIKYALQHGYLVQPAYTFGECDLYTSLQAGRAVRMWMLRALGFVVPIFWGPYWWCLGAFFLPRRDVPLHTVVGSPLKLPTIAEPTTEDVALWHGRYVAAITEIFDAYKGRFGYGDRTLEVV